MPSDPRIDFLNWSIWAAGAFDYPADRRRLTWGLTAELNQPRWAARLGYFLVGNEPNANIFDMNLFARGGYVGELELRFKPYDRPGTAKLGAWLTSTFAGSYNEAVALAAAHRPDGGRHRSRRPARAAPSTASISTWSRRSATISALFAPLQLERRPHRDQRLHRHRRQPVARPAAQGHRPGAGRTTAIGLGGALEHASRPTTATYLAAGGLGVLVGDGPLSYAAENVVEAYYAFQIAKGLIATADYQFLINPAYNADRGPAHLFAGRLSAASWSTGACRKLRSRAPCSEPEPEMLGGCRGRASRERCARQAPSVSSVDA